MPAAPAALPDVAVLGGGAVGLCAALALARLRLDVVLVPAPRGGPATGAPAAPAAPDLRAYALNGASVALLRTLKVWDSLPEVARTPVHDMQVHGDDDAACLHFSAWQQRAPELAQIVDAAALLAALQEAVRWAPHVTPCAGDEASTAAVRATLTVHAEGRGAPPPPGAAPLVPMSYGQRAVAARLVSDQPHANTARQWFRHPDVLALLPLDAVAPGQGHGLVWSLPEERAAELLALPDEAFEQALNDATAMAAGRLRLASPRAAWPLAIARAPELHGPGWVRVGDAAHVIHPLAGQGLNLGLADVASLAEVLAARESWRSIGDTRLLARHARRRAAPVQAMALATDQLLHLFAHPHPAVRELRNRGLALMDRLGPAKRWLASQAMTG